MVLDMQRVTPADFDRFIRKPENRSHNFELIAGEIIEKMVSSPRSSTIGALVGGFMTVHVRQNGLGRVTGADGGYMVNGERYIPDAAFISKSRQSTTPTDAYNPHAPDLAVELSSRIKEQTRIKVAHYLSVGTLTWVINPDKQRVEVYKSGQPPIILTGDEILDGGDVLPGFSLVVSTLFAE
ncbi:MAG: Uma2 family endonuclease [Chloroflexota bacterium]